MKDGVELISPILQADNKWHTQLDCFWKRLLDLCHLEQNKSCGLYIHISRVPEFEVVKVKEIARKILHFQPTIDQHFPAQGRVNNDFCQSNAGDLQELQELQDAPNLNQLIEIISPSCLFA